MNNTGLAPLFVINRRSQLESERLAQRLSDFLIRRKLNPAFSAFYVTRWLEMDIFIAVLDTSQISNQNPYKGDTLHQLSTDLGGLTVYLSNTTGLRYVVPLTKPPRLPRQIDLPSPEILGGKVGVGQSYTGRAVADSWRNLGHMLVTGITGSGKSMLLLSLVVQALRDGMQIAISDLDGISFPISLNHPALVAPIAQDEQATYQLLQRLLGEVEHRKTMYQQMEGAPRDFDAYNAFALKAGKEPLKRILLVMDEFSSTLTRLGGAKSEAGKMLSEIGMRVRKFGINIVFAAHEFRLDQVGTLRQQCNTIICFRTNSKELALKLGCKGAERIPADRPGLCITNNWGPMQAFFVNESLLLDGVQPAGESVDPDTARLFAAARDLHKGRVTGALVREMMNVNAGEAGRLQRTWALRSWLMKDKNHANAFVLTDRGLALIGEKPKTHETPENRGETAKKLKSDL